VRETTAAGQMLQVASRTADLLPLTCGVAEILHPDLELTERLEILRLRLQIGLPANVIELAELMQDRFSRADYLALAQAGLGDVITAAAATNDELESALGARSKAQALRETLTAAELSVSGDSGGATSAAS